MSKSNPGGVNIKISGSSLTNSPVTGTIYNNYNNSSDSPQELEELREKVDASLDATEEVKTELHSFLDKLEQAEAKKDTSKIMKLVAALSDGAKDLLVNLASSALQQRLGLPS